MTRPLLRPLFLLLVLAACSVEESTALPVPAAEAVSTEQVAAAVTAETGTQPVGQIDDGAARIRTNADKRTAEELGAMVEDVLTPFR